MSEESVNLKTYQYKSSNLKSRQKKRSKGKEQSLKDLYSTFKCTNICIMGIPEGEERVQRIFKDIMAKNFPNLTKDMNLHTQKAT